MDLEDDYSECEMFGCEDRLVGTEDGLSTYTCERCGAEWWEEE